MQYNILIKLYYFKYCVILLTTTKNKTGWAGRDWKEGGAVSDTIIRIRESSVDSSHFLSHLNEVRGKQKGKKSREVVINILDNGIQLRKANKDNFGIQETVVAKTWSLLPHQIRSILNHMAHLEDLHPPQHLMPWLKLNNSSGVLPWGEGY